MHSHVKAGAEAHQQLVILQQEHDDRPAKMSQTRRRDLFLLAVLVVVLLVAALYNFVIATPRYASEMSFVVRMPDRSQQRFSFLNVGSGGSGDDDSHAIVAYIGSRDILTSINVDRFVSRIFAADNIDVFSAFPSVLAGDGRERFFKHFQNYQSVDFDAATGITKVAVQAFDRQDARVLAERVMQASEAKVNLLNARARKAMIASSQGEVDAANVELSATLNQLEAVQRRFGVIDPGLEAAAAIGVGSGTASELSQINIQLANTIRAAPQSPLIGQLQSRRAAILADQGRQLASRAGGSGSLAERIGPFLEASAKLNIAEKRLLAASLALASAQNSASRSKIYIEWISRPGDPDIPTYPGRWYNLLAALLIGIGVLWIARSLSDLVLGDE